jgi:hypothetical protein
MCCVPVACPRQRRLHGARGCPGLFPGLSSLHRAFLSDHCDVGVKIKKPFFLEGFDSKRDT